MKFRKVSTLNLQYRLKNKWNNGVLDKIFRKQGNNKDFQY